jgi:hypothetical protein
MLNELVGDVWDLLDENSAVCILTNNTILYHKFKPFYGRPYNIMGGGIAKEAYDRNLGLKETCAESILNGSISLGYDLATGAEMLRFPTKDQIHESSDMRIIADSLIKLVKYINENPNKKIYLPRPGCGLGGLEWNDVKELCEHYLGKFENVYILSK